VAVAIPFIPYIVAAVGAGVAAYGAVQQGNAAKEAATFNAQRAVDNSRIAIENAGIERQNALFAAQQQDRLTYQRLGAIRAAAGVTGTTMEGSALDLLGDAAAQSELERQNILYSGELRARSRLNEARGFQSTAALDLFSGQQAERAGYLRAGSELMSGAGRASRAYNSYDDRALNRTG
jgi:hypothetical protein